MTQDNDLYTRVTNKIIADLEKGELTWRQPWKDGTPTGRIMRPLRWEGTPYTGINTLMLWMTAAEKGYRSPYWMTFKQRSTSTPTSARAKRPPPSMRTASSAKRRPPMGVSARTPSTT